MDWTEKFTTEEACSILDAIASDPELDKMVAEAITNRRACPRGEGDG